MAKKKPSIDVWLVAVWECGKCLERVESPASVNKGDTIKCESCGWEVEVASVCSD